MLVGVVGVAGLFIGCGDPVGPQAAGDTPVVVPAGATALLAEGFGSNLAQWEPTFMINVGDYYPQMRITTDAAHTGTHSITSDSNRTALVYNVSSADRPESGIAGIQFFIMTKAADSINFVVSIGQNAGSSGGLVNAFGLGFDLGGTLIATYKDKDGSADTLLAAITPNKWYKCRVEVDFTAMLITYFVDDVKVYTHATPVSEFYGLDRVLVFRGDGNHTLAGDYFAAKEGPKKYYADDIVLYKK